MNKYRKDEVFEQILNIPNRGREVSAAKGVPGNFR